MKKFWPARVLIGAAAIEMVALLAADILLLLRQWSILRWVGGPVWGIAIGVCYYTIRRLREDMREMRVSDELEEMFGLLPERMDAVENEDDTITVIVTRQNGEVTTLVTPPGYHPRQDNARWLVEQLLPNPDLPGVQFRFGEGEE